MMKCRPTTRLLCLLLLITISTIFYHRRNIRALVVMQYNVSTKWAPACRRNASRGEYMDRLKCPLRSTDGNPHLFNPDEELIFTYVNSAWTRLTDNWICSLRKARLNATVVIVALGASVCKNLKPEWGVLCWQPLEDPMFHQHAPTEQSVAKGAPWGTETYKAIIKFRTSVLYALLKCGQPVLHTDVDVVFLRNPLPYLRSVQQAENCGTGGCGYDIIFQRDSVNWGYVDYFGNNGWLGNWYACAGFMLLRPTRASLRFVEVLLNYQDTDWNDQAGINICLHYTDQGLRWLTLRGDLFPNGRMIQNGVYSHSRRGESKQGAYIHHYNWMAGQSLKIKRMKQNNAWCPDWS